MTIKSGLAVVTGAASGLGSMIAGQLENYYERIERWDTRMENQPVNVAFASDTDRAAQLPYCDLLVNCAGINKLAPIKDVTRDFFRHHMDVNAFGIVNCTTSLLPLLVRNAGTVCNIISNASHMPMRHSLAYNASKAAAEMVTRQMARELGDQGLTVFGVSPNRLAGTRMSQDVDAQVAKLRGWSMGEVKSSQRAAMPIGEETDPTVVAEFVAWLCSEKRRHRYLHGSILEYGI